MFRLDLEPLSSKLKNNRDAHDDYLQKTMEHTDTLRGIVEQARKLNPSDPYLEYACRPNRPMVLRLGMLQAYDQTSLSAHQLCRKISWHTQTKVRKDHLCSACSLKKSKKHTHKPNSEDSIQEKLYLLHMDLCGPIRIKSINGKKYILVIVDDYSWFTWVKFLRSKDETPEFVIKFLKMIQVRLNTTVRNIRTDNGTYFVNQTLKSYYEDVGISHQTSVAQGVATACYTQNRSLIHKRHSKTPYELLHDRKPDLKYLHVFGALCYPTNDSEDLGKLKPKADIGIFIGYAPAKKAYRIYNRQTR
ncbi:retrovirus-related pol polyprotein from transposon TNT 1-94 [Tanacetum coccineum]